ncbi:MAG: DUF554 domain-containing protein [Deltaproteobacteria bacterium]|nr:MAG: DUF554 domain-containing protein [Deltaproteobacteria bacterium]
MTGTFVNTGAIIAGSLIGVAAGSRIPERFKTILMNALGLSVIFIGLRMAFEAENDLLPVGSLILGAVTGELLRIEDGMTFIGERLKERFSGESSTFVAGFVAASVIYVTGAMMVVGSIKDGTVGDPAVLYIKSILDGVCSVVMASTMGVGVAFSALTVLILQGAVTLLAGQLAFLQEPHILSAINGTGGLMILSIGLNLLGITKIKTGNLLPALVYAVIAAEFF